MCRNFLSSYSDLNDICVGFLNCKVSSYFQRKSVFVHAFRLLPIYHTQIRFTKKSIHKVTVFLIELTLVKASHAADEILPGSSRHFRPLPWTDQNAYSSERSLHFVSCSDFVRRKVENPIISTFHNIFFTLVLICFCKVIKFYFEG